MTNLKTDKRRWTKPLLKIVSIRQLISQSRGDPGEEALGLAVDDHRSKSASGLQSLGEVTMSTQLPETLAVSVVNALTSNICVVDRDGRIVAVNRAWMDFSANNKGGGAKAYLGTNYLDLCLGSTGTASDEAPEFYNGLNAVLEGRSALFEIEYPCHSPAELRWFKARVTPLASFSNGAGEGGAVISHMNVTDRKKWEQEYVRLASTDPLTGLPNRRFFEDFARIELERLRRFGGEISLLMIDLDRFKRLNDRYGHPAGDTVLRKFAAACTNVVRESDLFARIGGEEFVALLVGADEASALELAERLRASAANLKIRTPAGTIRVTSSIGITSVTATDRSIDSAIQRADKALYVAKNAGRNRVEIAA